ncbi:hypothetical protein [Sneathiella aquimaris]|uniref:hypothetical protein n=1 Tax=Sneathiella aquimaris TaxID=2599305 RepID=UPI00146DD5D1|nr:hypothetical protein [Sneathiella aquimaris]
MVPISQPLRDVCQPLPVEELEFPLTYLQQEHKRHIDICHYFLRPDIFQTMCSPQGQELAARLYMFLTSQLPLLIKDEQQELFPRLLQSAGGRELQKNIEFASREHKFDIDLIEFVLADLKPLCKGHILVNPLRLELNLTTLLEGVARHAKWESETLISYAQDTLSNADLQSLSKKMKEHHLS